MIKKINTNGLCKDFAGLRNPEDLHVVQFFDTDSYGNSIIAHDSSCCGSMVVEVHSSVDHQTGNALENPKFAFIALNAAQQYDLAMLLLNNIACNIRR